MTRRVDDLSIRTTPPKASACLPVSEESAMQLTAAELDHVVGARSKPGASAGNGIGKPGSLG
jgi:hypothetical protein